MPGSTTRHAFPYPLGSDLAGTGDGALQSLSEMIDTKLDIAKNGSTMYVAKNLCAYSENQPNLPGYVVIQTNMTFGSYMTSLDIRGYLYQHTGSIVDLTINFYAYSVDQNIYNATVCNRGATVFSEALILRRDSDGKVAIALKPSTTISNQWQYPKLWVDGMFGHTDITESNLKSGWSMSRLVSLSGYTSKWILPIGWQTVATTEMLNSWVHYDTVRLPQYMKTYDGWVYFRGLIKNGTIGQPAFIMPAGFRPEITTYYEHHIPGVFNSAFGYFGINGTTGGIVPNSGANGYVDLSSIWYKSAPV